MHTRYRHNPVVVRLRKFFFNHYCLQSTIKSYTEGSAIQSTVSLELIEDCKLPLQRGLCTEKPEGNAQHQTSGG